MLYSTPCAGPTKSGGGESSGRVGRAGGLRVVRADRLAGSEFASSIDAALRNGTDQSAALPTALRLTITRHPPG